MQNNQSFIQPADRISSFKPYFFVHLGQKIRQLTAAGIDVIRIDIGSPDMPPHPNIIERLNETSKQTNIHGYLPHGGPPAFREALALYYQQRFNIDLDPQSETLGLIGSKEGIFNLGQVLINPGDIVLAPDPAYPVYKASATIAGGSVYFMPLLQENNFLPDLDAIPSETAERAKILWLNYPGNPTGAVAPLSFFKQAVEFALKHKLVIAHDAPYVDVCFDGYTAPSIMQIEGAKNCAVEFNSFSKSYNMAGWRLGMAVGNPEILNLLTTYKSQTDSSHFGPIYEAGITAIRGDQSWLKERNQIYQQRRDIIIEALKQANIVVDPPKAALYVWVKIPDGFSKSVDFCNQLLEETGVSTTPGSIYGQHGEGYLRISLGAPTQRIEEAMQRMVDWLQQRKTG